MNRQKLIGVSLAAIAFASPTLAYAQDASSPSSDAAGENEASGNAIVVTAQFRAQTVQETPLAITALSADSLAEKGATDITAAANLAPNVQLSSNAGNFGGMAAVFIRGVGQADPHFAVEPGVGMYVNDVYYGVMTGAILDLLDIDRVEILRGPQGTLAGKNSIGGAVKLFSQRPGPNADGFIEAGYGSRNSLVARAASSFTLIPDRLYARVAVGARHSDGYVDQLDYGCATGNFTIGTRRTDVPCKIGEQGGRDVYSGRASLLWTPNDRIENLLVADITVDRSQNPATKTTFQNASWTGGRNYITGPESYTNYENYVSLPTGGVGNGVPFVMPDETPVDAWGISNTLDIDLTDDLHLTSITGYRSSSATFSNSLDSAPASVLDQIWKLDHEQFTQELRLSGKLGSLLDWTLGGFYYDANGHSGARINIPGGLRVGGGGLNFDFLMDDPVNTSSKSAFLHTEWHLTDGLNVIAAIRYTRDKKDFTFNRYAVDGTPYAPLGTLINLTVPFKGERVDYRVAVNYEWSRRLMTYLQYSTGYKGGGVNPRPYYATQALPFSPEELQSYEAGFKGNFVDGRLTLNGAAFFNKYTNFQATILQCNSISPFAGAPCAQTANVGDAEIRGAELELNLEPVDGLTIDGSVGYLDFKYTRVNAVTGITLGMKNVYTPEWTASAGIQYKADLGSTGTLTPRIDLSYRASVQGNAINSAAAVVPERTLLNARLTWRSQNEDWQAELAVSNLADEFYYNSVNVRDVPPYFAGVGVVGEPRTVMFTIRKNFN